MCGGFYCSKNALVALNVLYILVSFILISVAAYAKAMAYIDSLPLVGGIVACGVFLFLIALIGLVGAVKHHQVLLFFYMVILFLVFLIQFAVSCACLAMNTKQQKYLIYQWWRTAPLHTKELMQKKLDCCGLNDTSTCGGGTDADMSPACCDGTNCTKCETCYSKASELVSNALRISGGIGLFFSFTELLGLWLAVRYRNQKDPRAHPDAFL